MTPETSILEIIVSNSPYVSRTGRQPRWVIGPKQISSFMARILFKVGMDHQVLYCLKSGGSKTHPIPASQSPLQTEEITEDKRTQRSSQSHFRDAAPMRGGWRRDPSETVLLLTLFSLGFCLILSISKHPPWAH